MTTLQDEPIVQLDESRPRLHLRKRIGCILSIGNPSERPFNKRQITESVARSGAAKKIRRLCIEWDSQMTTAWVCELFPNLEWVRVEGRRLTLLDELTNLPRLREVTVDIESTARSLAVLPRLKLNYLGVRIKKPKDHDDISRCRGIEHLDLWGWKENDLQTLSAIAVNRLGLIGGGIECLDGLNCKRIKQLLLYRCTKLATVAGISVPVIEIHACNRLDLGTLSSVSKLRILRLRAQKEIKSLKFVESCRSLASLMITAMRLRNRDFNPLIRSKSLRYVWLSATKGEEILHVGRANRRLVACDGTDCIVRGNRVEDVQPYYELTDRYERSLGI